jgi:sugar (pentulose or hexulose) kinase
MTVLDDRVMEPRTETRAVYEHAYRAYRQTYEALEPTFGEAPA